MSTFFDELEDFALSALAGVAQSPQAVPQIDASHPAMVQASEAAFGIGGVLSKIFPSAGALAAFGLPIVQAIAGGAAAAAGATGQSTSAPSPGG